MVQRQTQRWVKEGMRGVNAGQALACHGGGGGRDGRPSSFPAVRVLCPGHYGRMQPPSSLGPPPVGRRGTHDQASKCRNGELASSALGPKSRLVGVLGGTGPPPPQALPLHSPPVPPPWAEAGWRRRAPSPAAGAFGFGEASGWRSLPPPRRAPPPRAAGSGGEERAVPSTEVGSWRVSSRV